MIRDLSFDETERAGARQRMVKLVAICLLSSAVATFALARELTIRKEFSAIPRASLGDLGAMKSRHDAISTMLDRHHFWGGAFDARQELNELVRSIHEQQREEHETAQKVLAEENRIREEADAARRRGLALAERRQFDLALVQFRAALELCDSLSDTAWEGGPWQYREQLVVDIYALENLGEGKD